LRRGSFTTSDHQILCSRLKIHSRRTSSARIGQQL
jgi:hypothetical protein